MKEVPAFCDGIGVGVAPAVAGYTNLCVCLCAWISVGLQVV